MDESNEINETETEATTYEYPEYREVGARTFLEGAVGAFIEDGEREDDYYLYGEHAVPAEAVDSLGDHEYSRRVQIHTTTYETNGDKDSDNLLERCESCGKTFARLSTHQALSDCAEVEETD